MKCLLVGVLSHDSQGDFTFILLPGNCYLQKKLNESSQISHHALLPLFSVLTWRWPSDCMINQRAGRVILPEQILRKRAKERKTKGLCSLWDCHGVRAGVDQSRGGEKVYRLGAAAGFEAIGTCLKRRCFQAGFNALYVNSKVPSPHQVPQHSKKRKEYLQVIEHLWTKWGEPCPAISEQVYHVLERSFLRCSKQPLIYSKRWQDEWQLPSLQPTWYFAALWSIPHITKASTKEIKEELIKEGQYITIHICMPGT